MWLWLLVLCHPSLALFPGRDPDEGDVRHLYPITSVAIGFGDHAHLLPYILGWLENIEYPKSRLHLDFYLQGKEDTTKDQITWWKNSVNGLFASISIAEDVVENWEESALRRARLRKMKRILLLEGNTLPRNLKMIQDLAMDEKKISVSAMLLPALDGEPANVENSSFPEGNMKLLEETVFPLLIQLDAQDSSYLTFDSQNLPNYNGNSAPENVFFESARRMNIPLWLDGKVYHGVHFNENKELDEKRRAVRYHLCDLIADDRALPEISASVRPWTPEKELWGVDRIYVINLKRRPERLKKMMKIFDILGVDFTVLEASDGKDLSSAPKYKILPNYEDPFHKRPIKTGEIGCFLSHYRIWKEVVDENLRKVIVFEDDLRFSIDGLERVKEVLEDLSVTKKEWDLIYLGRKKQSADQEENWVPSHRHLSSVGYSYWTLGYLLSFEGAKRLLAADPLQKLLPVDEYIPIMFNKHPNEEWNSHFPVRDLRAFTLYPLVVFPQRYTFEAGYLSDTESSVVVVDAPPTSKDEL